MILDCLCYYYRHRYASGFPRMVPMASRVFILSGKGLPKSGEYKHKSARNNHDGFVYIASVS
jgi:hypothetical protein